MMIKHFYQNKNSYSIIRLRLCNKTDPDSIVCYDALVDLGCKYLTRTELPLRVVGYKVEGATFWIATNRYDLSVDEIALIYKLRW